MVHALLLLLAFSPLAPDGPPVRVWLGSGPTLASGDHERVYVQTSSDGHLVVLHARTDGRVEVLFPGDPASDPFVRAGTYEISGPAGGEAFAASGPEGWGMVVAALSPDPIWFDEFVHRGEWDVAALTGAGAGPDPEALLTDIVQRMLGDGSFNYDVVTYTVTSRAAAIADAGGYTLQAAGACIECSFTQVDLVVNTTVPFRRFAHRHRRSGVPLAPAAPEPAAIAVYSVPRPGATPRPLRAPLNGIAHVQRPVAPSAPAPRRRRPETVAATPSGPTTVAVPPIPLVARARPAAAWATAATRSLLLTRVLHVARSPGLVPATEPVTAGIAAVAARGLAPPSGTPTPGARAAVPAAAPAPVAAPETSVGARPEIRTGAGRAATVAAVPAPGRAAGFSKGVGLETVHTAGWRH